MRKSNRIGAIALMLAIVIVFLPSCTADGTAHSDGLLLCGHPIREYKIVTDKESEYSGFAAEIFARYLSRTLGYTLETVDKLPEKGYAVIMDDHGEEGDPSEFTVEVIEGDNILISGSEYSLSAGLSYLADVLKDASESDGKAVLEKKTNLDVTFKKADSVILLIGDGMGKNHIALSTAQNPTVTGEGGEEYAPAEKPCESFSALSFPNTGEAVTVNFQGMITDSAASATALATGYKTMNEVLGMAPADLDLDGVDNELRSVANVRETAALAGMKNAVLSTDRETGATPNAFLVHHNRRYDSATVLEQQKAIEGTDIGCDRIWCSYDSDDFFDEFSDVLTTFTSEDGGFFIMAEEAMIDKFASKLDYDNVIRTVKRFNKLIKYAACHGAFYGDIAVIVTADHETGGLTGDEGTFKWTSDGEHTDVNVGVYAMGDGTEIFDSAVRDNTEIARYIFNVIENSGK